VPLAVAEDPASGTLRLTGSGHDGVVSQRPISGGLGSQARLNPAAVDATLFGDCIKAHSTNL
jgi:hypothetical protein